MKAGTLGKYRVTPVNLRNGSKAPYFILETNGKKDEVSKLAGQEFSSRSSLSRSETWGLETEKI
jgi:hypothetical protein